MARLEELTRGASVRGILPDALVSVVDVEWHGSNVVELTYKDPSGHLGSELLFRDREPTIEIASAGRPWGFDGDGSLFRLGSEAHRIRLAYLFDPLLAVHTSLVEPLPHQITAVYEQTLTRQPLRFLLADDPGAGKTIMAGLFIKELMVRGDLRRCLIVCPGMLVEQWQDELDRRFHRPFEIMTNDKLEAARTGNWFVENPLAICRLDKLSRNDDIQAFDAAAKRKDFEPPYFIHIRLRRSGRAKGFVGRAFENVGPSRTDGWKISETRRSQPAKEASKSEIQRLSRSRSERPCACTKTVSAYYSSAPVITRKSAESSIVIEKSSQTFF